MKSHKQQLPEFVILDKLGSSIKVTVRQSSKAKRTAIRIKARQAELVLPNNNLKAAYPFLLSKEAWIRQKLAKIIPETYVDPNIIPIFDKPYSLQHIAANHDNVQIQNNIIQIYTQSAYATNTLMEFLRHKLLLEIEQLVTTLSKQHKLNFNQIKLIANKRKWGSCSSKKVLSFNWRLIFAPKEVLYYVVVHEMCHLVEMNHSPRFWKLVENIYPDYRACKAWLKENSLRLSQYLTAV